MMKAFQKVPEKRKTLWRLQEMSKSSLSVFWILLNYYARTISGMIKIAET